MSMLLLVFLVAFLCVILGIHAISLSRYVGQMVLLAFGSFILSGVTYVFLAFWIRCPACGFNFLRNPKSLGPAGFQAALECPKVRGTSAWAYQIGRFIVKRRIRCISCGREVFDAEGRIA
jgi:DNA-directed RNA polymerase subunit RPC12/RpoP